MSNYQHTLDLAATPAAVYNALTTIAGLRGWWTQDCDGGTAVGDTIHFRFGVCDKDVRISGLTPQHQVRWLCTRAHIVAANVTRSDEWVGTEMVFGISDAGNGRTRLEFEHIGLVPALQCYSQCLNGWQYFMTSLQQYAETGTGTPHVIAETATA
ncbi:SRPBCC family protein [Undibacterium sp. TJN19]|uniref:SRPBCC family protein n=1 Tax=Undibacterium sp. TJN19 TaxID=3413055 RepID=UPI003BEF7759